MSSLIEWGGDDTSTPQMDNGNPQRFKGKKGESYRLSYGWWPTLPDGSLNLAAKKPKFIGGKRSYIPNVGYVLNKGPEFTALAGGEQPRLAIGTIVIHWPTDKLGNIDQTRILNGEYAVMSWVFAEARYKVLDTQWREWPPGDHDVTALCEDEQYQKMTFSPCKNSLLKTFLHGTSDKHKAIAADIMSRIKAVEAKIGNEVARDLTLDEIRLKLGKGGPAPVVAAGGMSAQMDDMLENILDA